MADAASLSRLLGRSVERLEPLAGAGGWSPALRLVPEGMTPAIRRFQEDQMRVAVRWVARVLDLGEPFRR